MTTTAAAASIYDFDARSLTGEAAPLDQHRGKVLLIVNTASKCGFTPQYEGLEALWRAHREEGLVVLGFPCNQFGAQEPGSAEQIGSFCSLTYDVTFPMMAKVDVNGPAVDPLYAFLKHQKKGLLGSEAIKWNFTKFLVGRDGTVIARFAPTATPQQIEGEIRKALADG
ncbi:MAG TPA: glutathione peroxidase [Caulobacteraceae bacterium]|jgi:glutathione peroxidase|nr:glutathione peroxidase [Caulobacteraceae bacterium]